MEPKAALSALQAEFVGPTALPSHAPDQSEGANVVVAEAKRQPTAPVDDGPQPFDLRLVIEQNGDTGEYIYKTVDRRTGETLQQFPREQVLKLREEARYASGAVFDGKA
jgi:flagellar protein FlaG